MPNPHARGYHFNGLVHLDVTTVFDPSAFWGAGPIISSAADLATFFQALLGGTLLLLELLKAMKTTAVNAHGTDTGYGLGLMRYTTACGTMWGHGGDYLGYQTEAASSPDGTRSSVVMTNSLFPPAQVVEPLNRAKVAVMCQALLDHVPATAVAESAELPPFDDWSTLADVLEQIHRVTLNLGDLTQSERS